MSSWATDPSTLTLCGANVSIRRPHAGSVWEQIRIYRTLPKHRTLPKGVILRPPSRFAGLLVRDDVGDSRARNTRGWIAFSATRWEKNRGSAAHLFSSSSEKPIHPRFLIFRDLPKTSLAAKRRSCDLCLSSPASLQMPEEIGSPERHLPPLVLGAATSEVLRSQNDGYGAAARWHKRPD